MKKVVITGASGFIGNSLVKLLTARGLTVYGITRNNPLSYDVTDIDVFFHFSREGGYGKSFQNIPMQIRSIEHDYKAVELALKIGAKRFVFAQTYNYLEALEFIKGNIGTPRWTNVYAASKMASEIIGKTVAFNNQLEYISGAPCIIYGPGNHHVESFSNILFRKVINGEDLNLIEGNNPYDMVYIDDVVSAFAAIAESGRNLKTYYVGHRKLHTFKEIVTEIRDIVNPNTKLNFGVYPEEPQVIDWANAGLDDLYNDTGWEAKTSFQESILKTAEWTKNQMRAQSKI
jgi:nucleoside-diphosphate-sugar epimerase